MQAAKQQYLAFPLHFLKPCSLLEQTNGDAEPQALLLHLEPKPITLVIKSVEQQQLRPFRPEAPLASVKADVSSSATLVPEPDIPVKPPSYQQYSFCLSLRL